MCGANLKIFVGCGSVIGGTTIRAMRSRPIGVPPPKRHVKQDCAGWSRVIMTQGKAERAKSPHICIVLLVRNLIVPGVGCQGAQFSWNTCTNIQPSGARPCKQG